MVTCKNTVQLIAISGKEKNTTKTFDNRVILVPKKLCFFMVSIQIRLKLEDISVLKHFDVASIREEANQTAWIYRLIHIFLAGI